MRYAGYLTVIVVMVLMAGCSKTASTSVPQSSVSVRAKAVGRSIHSRPAFVPPIAEEAYRLQDDCTRRGAKVLRDNVIGSALTQEATARYNALTNRCYVRLEVHAKDLNEWEKHDVSTYIQDGQTGELLAFLVTRAGGEKSFQGFGCGDFFCVSRKISACMNGKECDTDEWGTSTNT